MNLIQKYGKKKVIIASSILIVAVTAVGIGTWYMMEENYKKSILDSIDITFVEEAVIEYGTEEVDLNSFIKEITGEPEVILPTDEIDTMVLAKKDLVYKISKDGYSKDKSLSVEIKDTKAPEINLKEDIVTLEYGAEYNIQDNIESVKDPVDGDIAFVDTAGENNYYTVDGEIDTSITSDYTITIKAVDKNMMNSEKTYLVHVNEEVESKTPTQGGNSPSSNNGGGNSSKPGTATGGGNASGANGGNGNGGVAEPVYRTDISNSYASQINAYREANGLSALPVTAEAQAEANKRAMELVNNYGHNGSYGFGENIGMGDIGYNFFEGWKASPGHNANMLRGNKVNETSVYLGYAVAVVEFGGKWYAVTSFQMNY